MADALNDSVKVDFTGYFECVLQEESHIRAKIIKVTIPSLFGEVENKFTPTENKEATDKDQRVANTNTSVDENYTSTTIIEAMNHTDYHYQL